MLSEDEILAHFEKMTKNMDCDPILVSGTIFYVKDKKTGKPQKMLTLALLPIILTPTRYLSFVQSFGGEYRFNEERCTHEQIFWCKYNKKYKTMVDMYNANIDNIRKIMGKYKNPEKHTPENKTDSGIILPG